ncbi:MAG: DUF4012 domain-containing protein [Chloroflexi bacterium]|nr:DUF4012 domain-containing protein [Chloroflexota bacterium]
MVIISPEYLEDLKYILENSLHPQQLDAHPWTASPIIQEVDGDSAGPGRRLVLAISQLFAQMMPSTPPKRGKRLDTRWGEFGLLAAQYFAPLQYGAPPPASLRDAWGRIDASILLFVYGKSPEALTPAEKEAYKLVGDEPEVGPSSTLSDWHRKGLMRLAEIIQAREKYLGEAAFAVPPLQNEEIVQPDMKHANPRRTRRILWGGILLLLLLLAGILTVGGLKARRAYELALVLRQDVQEVQSLRTLDATRLEQARQAGPLLARLRQDFDALEAEVGPYLWIGSWLGWVPTYGGDLAAVQELVSLADGLLETAKLSYDAAMPILEENERSHLDLPRLTSELVGAQPQLAEVQASLDRVVASRDHIAVGSLSPEVRVIVDDVDRIISLLQDGLSLGVELPRLLGASDEGPKTYLLLVQNEDELRPTGGFITASGTLLLQDGRMGNLNFSNSGDAEDWTKPYPIAPWQLQEYMDTPVLVLRDANWFTHYPTAAQYAEYLYSLSSDHSVDGVIAFDQHLLVILLGVTGPLQVDGADYPVDAGNVISYMRVAKVRSPEEEGLMDWDNKAFLNKITRALLEKIFSDDTNLEDLALAVTQALNEHHILVQVDNPTVSTFLAKYLWDGGVHPSDGDFLMVVDTNVGFNKTNAVVTSSLAYEVDLRQVNSLTSVLTVFHKNDSVGIDACNHRNKVRVAGEEKYPIQDCYWNYLRVYTPQGTFLVNSKPQSIPAEWMIGQASPPARVDVLAEKIEGVQGFGTIQVVPASSSLTTEFQFLLPLSVMQVTEDGQLAYRLKVQKQPGTSAIPITIRIHLPEGAQITKMPPGATVDETGILIQTDLRLDLQIEIIYRMP